MTSSIHRLLIVVLIVILVVLFLILIERRDELLPCSIVLPARTCQCPHEEGYALLGKGTNFQAQCIKLGQPPFALNKSNEYDNVSGVTCTFRSFPENFLPSQNEDWYFDFGTGDFYLPSPTIICVKPDNSDGCLVPTGPPYQYCIPVSNN